MYPKLTTLPYDVSSKGITKQKMRIPKTPQTKEEQQKPKAKKQARECKRIHQGTRLASKIYVEDKMVPLDSLLFLEGFWGVHFFFLAT